MTPSLHRHWAQHASMMYNEFGPGILIVVDDDLFAYHNRESIVTLAAEWRDLMLPYMDCYDPLSQFLVMDLRGGGDRWDVVCLHYRGSTREAEA